MCLGRNELYATVTEKQFHQQIVQAAHLCGWMLYHTYDSRRSEAGYPDDTLVHPVSGDFFLIEEKTEKGRLSPAQKRWIAALEASHIEVHVYRPHQIDEIIARLQRTKHDCALTA